MVALSLKVLMFALLQLGARSQRPSLAMSDSTPPAQGSLGSALRGAGVVVTDQVDKAFLLEVEEALGTQLVDRSRDRMEDIMKGLRPMFESLAKNEYGKLEHTAVRYTLHRLFVARHGWLMKGLDPAGQLFNSSSPVEVLQGKAPVHVQEIFEKRLVDQGFGLQELAVFASVLETLIHTEAVGRLEDFFIKLKLPLDSKLRAKKVDDLLELYMTAFILGTETLKTWDLPAKKLKFLRKIIPTAYFFWNETQAYVREVRMEILGTAQDSQHSLAEISEVLVEIGERFGTWQNTHECHGMKKRLIDLEVGQKGCVPLSSFYMRHDFPGAVTSGGKEWQFGESIDYMKEAGIIDASDPQNPKVMMANYIYAPANCIASSYYYAVCCIDECESLFGRIERQVRGTTASPDELAALVAAMPSDTVPANRTLSPSQFHRLFKIAEKHGGRVPIHGRLFMQWMHMVYPRECAYPHMSGTTNPLTPEKWDAANNKSSVATVEDMTSFVNVPVLANRTTTDQGQCGRWVEEEELFVKQMTRRLSIAELESDFYTWVATSSVFLLCLAAVGTLAAASTFKAMKRSLLGGRKQDIPFGQSLMLV